MSSGLNYRAHSALGSYTTTVDKAQGTIFKMLNALPFGFLRLLGKSSRPSDGERRTFGL